MEDPFLTGMLTELNPIDYERVKEIMGNGSFAARS